MTVDLRGVRQLTLDELRELRKRGGKRLTKKLRKIKRRNQKPKRGQKVIVTAVSILPELRVRVARDIGRGNFSRGVTLAVRYVLEQIDAGKLRSLK